MGREGRDYWEAQLSEYWDSGLTIQEYSELKELPYESTRRWILSHSDKPAKIVRRSRRGGGRVYQTGSGIRTCVRFLQP